MPRIVHLAAVESIQPGIPPQIAPDGTILNPVPYLAANVTFDAGVTVQVERPLTVLKLQAAYKDATAAKGPVLDGIAPGDLIPP